MSADHKKKLGIYYTPSQVTDCLSQWAIRSQYDYILEPSFGGCNFLTSSIKVLSTLGANQPYQQIFGFDIDTKAFEILRDKKLDSNNFLFKDFLSHDDTNVFETVDVVLGNPPYLPIHKLETTYKTNLYKKFKSGLIKIPRRASLWSYFVSHSLKYLKLGGRTAWVLPDSLTFTHYGQSLLKQLSALFCTVKVIRIEERYFASTGTKEKTAFLLCEGYKEGTCEPLNMSFMTLDEALDFVSFPTKFEQDSYQRKKEIKIKISDKFTLATLGDVFNIRIGIVIGATKLLVLDKQNAQTHPYYPNFLYPIITKGKQLKGIVTNKRLLVKYTEQMPYLLIDGLLLETEEPKLFEDLVKAIPPSVLTNSTFRNRSKLFGYDDFKHPDAFLTFYSQGLPRLIVNEKKELNSTNSVHRLYAKEKTDIHLIQFIAIQIFAGLLSDKIEQLARPYGNSIRKFEPSDAQNIPVIIPLELDADIKVQIKSNMKKIGKSVDTKNLDEVRREMFEWLNKLIERQTP